MAIKYVLGLQYNVDEMEIWRISGASYKDAKTLGDDMDALKRICDHFGVKSRYLNGMRLFQNSDKF